MKEGENVMMDFVELEDGKIIDGLTAKLIRDELRSTCHELHKKELLSRNWTSIGITARSFVFAHIYAKFPYLMLCHNDWKINSIVGPIVSQWWVAEDKRVAKRTGVPVKAVRIKKEKDILPKRSSSASPSPNDPPSKRQRLSDAPSSPLAPPLSHIELPADADANTELPTMLAVPQSLSAAAGVSVQSAAVTVPTMAIPPPPTAAAVEVVAAAGAVLGVTASSAGASAATSAAAPVATLSQPCSKSRGRLRRANPL